MTKQKCTVLQTGVCRTFTGNKFVSRHEPESRDHFTNFTRHGCLVDPAPKTIYHFIFPSFFIQVLQKSDGFYKLYLDSLSFRLFVCI